MNPLYHLSTPLPYRILAMDLDGTLVDSDKKIRPATYTALMEAQLKGLTVVIASGRPSYGCQHIADELELQKYGGYVLSYNGGKITDCESGSVLGRRTIPLDLVRTLYALLVGRDVVLITYTHDEIITECPDNPYVLYESKITGGMPIRRVDSFVEAVERAPFKCAVVGEPAQVADAKALLEHSLAGRLNFLFSAETFLEIVPADVDKGAALDFLLKDQGIDRAHCIAVGDNYNDLAMIRTAGLGVAMANATEVVKRVADYVTMSNDEDGIQHLIYKYILHPESEHQIQVGPDLINSFTPHTLMASLGIKCTVLREGYVEATMPVDDRTQQPMGILHGGASLALAETVAGYGSTALLRANEIQVGMQVSGNHVRSAHRGETVTAIGTIVHHGRSTHVWNVDILSEAGDIICTARVINSILKRR